jgi:hypothetical protein
MADDGRRLQLMPGYWFEHNMYALVRNARKYQARDKRVIKEQNVEYDFLAPDSAEEMIRGMEMLGSAIERQIRRPLGQEDFDNYDTVDASLDLVMEGMAYKRQVRILHPLRGYLWYRKMLRFYGARELKSALENVSEKREERKSGGGKGKGDGIVKEVIRLFSKPYRSWVNIGGQLIPEPELQELLRTVRERRIDSWEELHRRYDEAWTNYPQRKTAHALHCLLYGYELGADQLNADLVGRILRESADLARELLERAYASRRKDYENPFRRTTFRNPEELEAVWGKVEDISFLKSYSREIEAYCRGVEECLSILS